MDLESFLGIGFDLGTFLQGQMRIGKLRSAYNLLMSRLLLILQVLDIKPTYRSSWSFFICDFEMFCSWPSYL